MRCAQIEKFGLGRQEPGTLASLHCLPKRTAAQHGPRVLPVADGLPHASLVAIGPLGRTAPHAEELSRGQLCGAALPYCRRNRMQCGRGPVGQRCAAQRMVYSVGSAVMCCRTGVSIYSRRVLIKQKTDGLLPDWVRFVATADRCNIAHGVATCKLTAHCCDRRHVPHTTQAHQMNHCSAIARYALNL